MPQHPAIRRATYAAARASLRGSRDRRRRRAIGGKLVRSEKEHESQARFQFARADRFALERNLFECSERQLRQDLLAELLDRAKVAVDGEADLVARESAGRIVHEPILAYRQRHAVALGGSKHYAQMCVEISALAKRAFEHGKSF